MTPAQPLVRHSKLGWHFTDPEVLSMRELKAETRRLGWETRKAVQRRRDPLLN